MTYEDRQRELAKLGFSSYSEYLESDLWERIRKTVLHRDACRCRNPRCKSRRKKIVKQVHHLTYSVGALLGAYPFLLLTLCEDCHHLVEHDSKGNKLSLRDVFHKTLNLFSAGRERKPGLTARKVGLWFKNQSKTNQKYALALLEAYRVYLPKWYTITVKFALEGRLGAKGAEYLNLETARHANSKNKNKAQD